MRKRKAQEQTHEIAFESFGVRVSVGTVSERQLELVRGVLPPGWKPCSPEEVTERFTIESDPMLRFVLLRDGQRVSRAGMEFEHLLLLLDSQMRSYIALHAPDLIFVHAGAVAVGDRLLVLPGLSFAGKTTLVAALVRAGATYYSDEYAPIDEHGLVHPYPRPLALRNPDFSRNHQHVSDLGGVAAEEPMRISRIVVTSYRRDGQWQPEQLSPGASVLALLSHTVAARSRPEQSMRFITEAVKGATAYESLRGDADEIAALLVEELSA